MRKIIFPALLLLVATASNSAEIVWGRVLNNGVTFKSTTIERARITAFVDVSCSHCQALFADVETLNASGVTINFIPFAKDGVDSMAGRLMSAAWCSGDKQAALRQAFTMAGPRNDDCRAIIEQGLDAAKTLKLSRTPSIIMPNGRILEGYTDATTLISAIKSNL